jgi:hypothetical protein
MNVDQYILDIDRFIELAENMIDDNPAALEKKIELLVKAHVLLGEVSGELYHRHKLLHVKRKSMHWDAYEKATGNKKMTADRAVQEIEELEADYAGRARKHQNRFHSIEEEIHALKQKQRVNLAAGPIGNY